MKFFNLFEFRSNGIDVENCLDYIVPGVVIHLYDPEGESSFIQFKETHPKLNIYMLNFLNRAYVSMSFSKWNRCVIVSWLFFDFEICFNYAGESF